MSWLQHPFAWASLCITVLALGLSIWAWLRSDIPGRTIFITSMAITALWAIAYLLQIASTNAEQAFFWLQVHMIGPIVLPSVWLVLPCHYAGWARFWSAGRLGALVLIPIVSLTLLHVVPVPNAMVRGITMVTVNELSVLRATPGPWYWVHSGYSYLLVLIIVGLLSIQIARMPAQLRAGPAVAVGAFAGLVAFHVWTQSVLTDLPFNPATLVSALAFLSLAWGIYRFRLLDLMPLARTQVIDTMSDGVIVMDAHQRIVDLNHAACQILGLNKDHVLGLAAHHALPFWPPLARGQTTASEVTIGHDGAKRHYALTPVPLLDARGNTMGQILTLHDITPQVRARREQDRLIGELREIVVGLRTREGLLPVCAWCGQVRDDDGSWMELRAWLDEHRILEMTHSVCPECEARVMEELDEADDGEGLARAH